MRAVLGLVAFAAACQAPFVEKPFYFVDLQGQNPVQHIVQRDRPASCPESMQPAIVDFDGPARTPVWACITACKPDQEPVTYAMVLPEATSSTQLSARCEPICPANEHRESYIVLGDREFHQHCADGMPPPAVTAEQERVRRVHDAHEREAYAAIEEQIAQLGGRAVPWDAPALAAYNTIDTAIEHFDRDWTEPKSSARLHGELARFDALHRRAIADARARHREDDRLERAEGNCNYAHSACRATCTKLPAACDQCEHDLSTCETAAKKGS